MRVIVVCSYLVIFLLTVISLNAQDAGSNGVKRDSLLNKITDIDSRLKEYSTKDTQKGFSSPLKMDTIRRSPFRYRTEYQLMDEPERDRNGLLVVKHDWTPFGNNISFRDTVIFDPAFLPVVFDGRILPSTLDFTSSEPYYTPNEEFHLISPDSTFAPLLKRVDHIQAMRRMYYMNNPPKIRLNAFNFDASKIIEEKSVEKRNPFKELISADNAVELSRPDIEKISIKPVYWLKNGSHKLEMSQNTFSEHWSGENNFNVYSEQKVNLNYKKNKVYFNNLIEWRLSIQQMKADTINKVNILDDLFRTYSTFGLNAFKNWSYSSNLEMKTPLFNRYNINEPKETRKRQRALLSPFELNLGIGMRYAKEITFSTDKYKKFNITADLSLISVNYRYVRADDVDEVQFGITENYRDKHDFGSTYNLNVAYSQNRYTNYNSRLKYFTNYERVYVEWENSVNFKINNYFSTSLYLYLKFDDSLDRRTQEKDRWARYFSYYERLGFGLNYTW